MTNEQRKLAKLGLAIRSGLKLLYFKRKNNPKIIRHQRNGRLHIQYIYPEGAIR